MAITLVDFGLFILIWLTQLVVYPSFTYFREQDLVRWHSKYTTAISYLVMPLMLGQVGLHLAELYFGFNWWRVSSVTLIGLAWINTFFYAVPLHHKITTEDQVADSAKSLVRINWYRTVIWSLVFFISLFLTVRSQGLFD